MLRIKTLSALAALSFSSIAVESASAQGCSPPPSGLLAWWSGDFHADDLAADNDGTGFQVSSYTPGRSALAADGSFSFDGSGGEIVGLPTATNVVPTDRLSVGVWVKIGALRAPYMTAYDRLGGGGFGMSVLSNGHAWFTLNGGFGDAESATNLDDNNWHHLLGTYDVPSGRVRLYVDGILESTDFYSTPISYTATSRHAIGSSRNSLGSRFNFNGQIDDVMVFDRELTASEAAALATVRTCPPCGTTFCTGVANSTGMPSTLCAMGSPVAATNVLTLINADLPAQSTVLFLVSRQTGFVANPGGSDGNLCLGGSIGRYLGPGQLTNSGAAGTATLRLNLTLIPQGSGVVAATAGDTFHFQTWHRDVVGGMATSNLSSGLSVPLR